MQAILMRFCCVLLLCALLQTLCNAMLRATAASTRLARDPFAHTFTVCRYLLFSVLLLQTLYNAMLENNCSEHASRMSAMENSSKSAGEILERLTLQYNRDRQATITNELIEIISGAAALEESG
jgi:ATP synthase F1 gamma subunit